MLEMFGYILIMLTVIVIWFALLKRPIYEGILAASNRKEMTPKAIVSWFADKVKGLAPTVANLFYICPEWTFENVCSGRKKPWCPTKNN